MHFRTMLHRALSFGCTALAALSSIATAAETPAISLDPACAQGYYPGFHTASFQYDLPATRFINATGSFFNSEWATGPISATQGKDKTIGATRSGGNSSGTIFIERLIGYSLSTSKLEIQYILDNGPITAHTTPEPTVFGTYAEQYSVLSTCAGTATYVAFTAAYCTTTIVPAYNAFTDSRISAMSALADSLGAQAFVGTCPLVPSY